MSHKNITEPSFKDFIPLGKNLKKGLRVADSIKDLYSELKELGSRKGMKGIFPAEQKLVQLYFPWSSEFSLGYISNFIEKKEDGIIEDVTIEMKLVATKKDTRKTPIPISLDKYSQLKEEGSLSSVQFHRVLNRGDIYNIDERLRYYMYGAEKVEVLEWMNTKK